MKTSMLPVRPASLKTVALALISLFATVASAQDLHTIFPLQKPSVSTITSNGDVNPYGVFFVPKTIQAGGGLRGGDILVSNFNNSANLQGLGTTILHVDAAGLTSTFYTASPTMSGLTAALGVLTNGVVLIGNLPTSDGTPNTAQAGHVSIVSSFGQFLGMIGNSTTVGHGRL